MTPETGEVPGSLDLLINPATGEVMINAHAALLAIHDPDDRRRWLAYVEWMLTEHKNIRAKNESARNN